MLPNRRLLIVEDHADTRTMLAMLLKTRGFEIVTASSVADALRAAHETPFDACIADIGLVDGSGNELMRELNEKHKIKGIAYSGNARQQDINEARAAGFTEYLVKPVDLNSILEAIDRVLG